MTPPAGGESVALAAPPGPSPRSTWAAAVSATAGRADVLVFGVAPLLVLLGLLWVARHDLAFDLQHAFRPAAEAALRGDSPYPPATREVMAERNAFVYLPFAAYLFAPFALLPAFAGDLLATALMVVLGAAALWILGVRDWRCYGITAAMSPVLSALQTANLTLPLLLALAGLWALRSRTVAPGIVLALTLATKLFLWPMLVWWLATRRYRAVVVAAVATALLVVGSWSLIAFAGLREYPELLRALTDTLGTDSYTFYALASDLGVGELPARLLMGAVATAVLTGCFVLGRRGDDARSFGLAVLASLLFSPIVWLHYFALLLAPVAIAHRRLSHLWLLPLVLWLCAEGFGNGTTVQTGLTLATVLTIAVLAVRAAPRGGATAPVAA